MRHESARSTAADPSTQPDASLASRPVPRARFTRKEIANAWRDGGWSSVLGGIGSGYWRGQPGWYRALSWLGWMSRHVTWRPMAAWHIARGSGYRDAGTGLRLALNVARGVACCFLGRVDHGYPGYPDHQMSWELATWDGRSWNGGEYTCWSATCAAVCTGRAWHVHIYEESGP